MAGVYSTEPFEGGLLIELPALTESDLLHFDLHIQHVPPGLHFLYARLEEDGVPVASAPPVPLHFREDGLWASFRFAPFTCQPNLFVLRFYTILAGERGARRVDYVPLSASEPSEPPRSC